MGLTGRKGWFLPATYLLSMSACTTMTLMRFVNKKAYNDSILTKRCLLSLS